MDRDEKRRLLGKHQAELMEMEGQTQMLACYGDDIGEPGYCVTIMADGEAKAYWFSYAERFSGTREWLEKQLQPEPDED